MTIHTQYGIPRADLMARFPDAFSDSALVELKHFCSLHEIVFFLKNDKLIATYGDEYFDYRWAWDDGFWVSDWID